MKCRSGGEPLYRRCWTMIPTNLGEMTLPELVELMRKIVDEIEIRMMQNAQ